MHRVWLQVAVEERSVDELLIALAHVTKRAAEIGREIEMEAQKVEQWKVKSIHQSNK